VFDAHVFVATRQPSPRELHCLATHLTDKVDVPVKIERNGRVIRVCLPAGRFVARPVQLDTNAFVHRETLALAPWSAESGDIATISMRLCYTIHEGEDGSRKARKRTPFHPENRLHRQYRKHFLAYLEQKTGLAVVNGDAQISIVVAAAPTPEERAQKVWFNGLAELKVRAPVVNLTTFGHLAGAAIGNRRTYGFGSVFLDGLEEGIESGCLCDSDYEGAALTTMALG